jgi:TRAP-type C4-dicarboxylate transport system permease small subunit
VKTLHDDLQLIVRVLIYITPPLLILFGFILIEINYANHSVVLDWGISIIGVAIIILGGILLAVELYLNMHKHSRA